MSESGERSGGTVAQRARRTAATVCAGVALAVAPTLVVPASAHAADGTPAVAAALPSSPSADTNGDRVFDDLASRLAPLPAAARVNVIVRLDTSAVELRLGLLQALVGPFALGRVLALVDGFSATVTKEQVELLRTAPGVASIEENGVIGVENVPGNADFGVTKARADGRPSTARPTARPPPTRRTTSSPP